MDEEAITLLRKVFPEPYTLEGLGQLGTRRGFKRKRLLSFVS